MTSFYKGLLRLSGARYVDGLATGHFFSLSLSVPSTNEVFPILYASL